MYIYLRTNVRLYTIRTYTREPRLTNPPGIPAKQLTIDQPNIILFQLERVSPREGNFIRHRPDLYDEDFQLPGSSFSSAPFTEEMNIPT